MKIIDTNINFTEDELLDIQAGLSYLYVDASWSDIKGGAKEKVDLLLAWKKFQKNKGGKNIDR